MFKMTVNLGKFFHRAALNQSFRNGDKIIPHGSVSVLDIGFKRTLFSKESMGIDAFEQQRERTKIQLSNLEEKFKTRMQEYVNDEHNMIFSEDLKNMVHLANNDQEVSLVVSMIERFNKQNKQLRFGNFKFGTIVMRLFHILNKPDVAIECFRKEESSDFFNQLMTFQIYLDLLFENQMYKEILQEFESILNRQIEGAMFPRNSVVLVFAACYKLNTNESLEYAFKVWKKLEVSGYYASRRAVTYCAALALKQGKLNEALEIVSTARNQSYTTVRNIKALVLTKLGRLEDVIVLLKSVLSQDMQGSETHTFNSDVFEEIKKSFQEAENSELSVDFNRIEQLFQKQGHISNKTLDEQLFTEIRIPFINKQQGNINHNRQRNTYGFRNSNQNYIRGAPQRPGLEDLV
ncbi:hypothetical protein WA026_021717 [Henosepilachna vigintioctopunctata]|uniref:Pentatricopeptide repeat-containing protein 2 n=1 Tax=Henosepilachna vigintioctopunctata TaxID=420089 RepID=A0AAW1TXA7_9CUCU